MIGQLYLVETRARLVESKNIEYCSYILSASNKAEVHTKLSYFVDKSIYDEFHIRKLFRIKPNFHMVRRKVIEAEAYFAAKETQQQMAQQGIDEAASPTLQEKNNHVFAFGLIGHIAGHNEAAIMLRLSNFLAQKSMGSNKPLPFIANGHFVIERLGTSDSTRISDLSKNDPIEFEGGRIVVSGGGCSPR